MPAFQLQQFQQQLNQLLVVFALPTEFHQQLTAFLERYEQPSYRYGEGVKAPPEPAYHLQSLMMEELLSALTRMAAERPRSAMYLAQECWTDPFYEIKKIAVVVMGRAPLFDLDLFEDAFHQMLQQADPAYLDLLLFHGIENFAQQHFTRLIDWITGWLDDGNTREIGYAAIQGIIDRGNLDHLPTVFRLIEPAVIRGESDERDRVLSIMDGLAALSPMETAYFLSENTRHFYGEERMHYFRALCRSLDQPQRDFVNRAFLDPSAFFHEEDVLDD